MSTVFNAGCTMFRLRTLCIKSGETQHYPIPLYCDQECVILYKNARSQLLREWREKYGKEGKNLLCILSQERPFSIPYAPNTALDEIVYFDQAQSSQCFRYCKEDGDRKVFSWLFQEGDIVEILGEQTLSLGIVVRQPVQSAIQYASVKERWLSTWRTYGKEMDWSPHPGDDRYLVLAICEDGSIEERYVSASRLIQTYSLPAVEQCEALRAALW